MAIEAFEGHYPELHPSVYVAAQAYVSGRTCIGEGSSVWPMAVIRGDIHTITIGNYTNVQDGTVLHVTHPSAFSRPEGFPLTIGDEVTIGHRAVLHACTIGNRCLIGMGAIVLDGAVVEDEVVLGAGSLVPPGKRLASGHLYMGSPAKPTRPLTDKERAFFHYSARYYAELAQRTLTGLASRQGGQ